MKKIYRGIVENNTLKIYEKEEFKKLIQSFNGKEIAVTLEKYFKNRTTPENNYYWGVIIKILSEETGDDPDSIHQNLKYMFLMEKGNVFEKVKSTTELTTTQFEKYMTEIRNFSSIKLGIYIPLPNEIEQSIYS